MTKAELQSQLSALQSQLSALQSQLYTANRERDQYKLRAEYLEKQMVRAEALLDGVAAMRLALKPGGMYGHGS